jgi:hypothetical protein
MDEAKRGAARIMAKVGPGLLPPEQSGSLRCAAQVRIYIGQRRAGGTWVQCSRRPGAGHRTCHQHRDQE